MGLREPPIVRKHVLWAKNVLRTWTHGTPCSKKVKVAFGCKYFFLLSGVPVQGVSLQIRPKKPTQPLMLSKLEYCHSCLCVGFLPVSQSTFDFVKLPEKFDPRIWGPENKGENLRYRYSSVRNCPRRCEIFYSIISLNSWGKFVAIVGRTCL